MLEYDGFEFHFEKGIAAGLINESTWRSYLTPEDLEREKVLESFGVKMIRLNRFNLGPDPVATIDALLRQRLNGGDAKQSHVFANHFATQTNKGRDGKA